MMPVFRLRRVLPLFLLVFVTSARGEAPRPAGPKEYDVQLRYRIYAGRNERIKQYIKLVRNLEAAGLQLDEGEFAEAEDTRETRMTGKLAASNVRAVLRDPHVKSILLLPTGYKLPAEGNVKVHLELASGLPLDRQRALGEQIRPKLEAIGSREYTAYDHHGFTRIVGTIPAGDVAMLLNDLRWLPGGWLAPDVPVGLLPEPLRSTSPIRIIEVIPEPEGAPPAKEAPAAPAPPEKGQEQALKISPDLRELAGAGKDDAVRMEVFLNHTPSSTDADWRRNFSAAGVVIEGRLGPLVTVLGSPKAANILADIPAISVVRLPRPATPQMQLPKGRKDGNLEALDASGLSRLHTYKHRGRGIKIAVIDGDFRGYQDLIGRKKAPRLPKGTRYFDLTAERNDTLEPDKFKGDEKELGHGTQLALAVALAAPEASITLVRIDPGSPHQLQAVARYIHGEDFRSESYQHRYDQIERQKQYLSNAKEKILAERKVALDNFGQTKEDQAKRDEYFKKQAAFDAEEKAFNDIVRRMVEFHRDARSLRDTDIVTSALVWHDGYPLGASSPLSRYFDDRPFKATIWFQSAGNTRGQAWSGLFRDADGNGVMEFAPPGTPLRPERWTPELNFLGFKPYGKPATPDLPAAAKLRITMQWREVHSPEFFRETDDLYLQPVANLRMVLLRQRDPKGEKLYGDEMEIAAVSTERPQRLENHPTFAIYEQALEFNVDPAGRYALRIEGRAPETTRPFGAAKLDKLEKSWELRPRIFLDVLDEAARKQGRAIFLDYPTDLGTLGTPSDSHSLITIGAADVARNSPTSDSALGPAWNLELLRKPDAWSFGDLRLLKEDVPQCIGANQAAGVAAGMAAASFSAGTDRRYFLKAMRDRTASGKPMQAP
jgi:hypothetical protein